MTAQSFDRPDGLRVILVYHRILFFWNVHPESTMT